MLFVSLEVVTLSSYVLAGYFRRNQGSIEAGIKYLVLGAMSTGILVYGIAWYFGVVGSFDLGTGPVVHALMGGTAGSPTVGFAFLMAVALLFSGAFFKVGAAPMHVWIPDVYQGAPTPTTTFLAVGSKTAGFALLCILARPFAPMAVPGAFMGDVLVWSFAIVAAATLLIGNLGALRQNNLKRLLGYSSIGQAGFILVFFLNMGSRSLTGLVGAYMLGMVILIIAGFTYYTSVAQDQPPSLQRWSDNALHPQAQRSCAPSVAARKSPLSVGWARPTPAPPSSSPCASPLWPVYPSPWASL